MDVGIWTNPADFGDERGALIADSWETFSTQYGLLKAWQINNEGSYVDGFGLSNTILADLDLSREVGVKSDANHVGGVNLFGSQFGNCPQDIVMSMRY